MSEIDWENFDSGPFCRHWGDPSDCDELCATCGHRCTDHSYGNGEPFECMVDDCKCEEWVESQ